MHHPQPPTNRSSQRRVKQDRKRQSHPLTTVWHCRPCLSELVQHERCTHCPPLWTMQTEKALWQTPLQNPIVELLWATNLLTKSPTTNPLPIRSAWRTSMGISPLANPHKRARISPSQCESNCGRRCSVVMPNDPPAAPRWALLRFRNNRF